MNRKKSSPISLIPLETDLNKEDNAQSCFCKKKNHIVVMKTHQFLRLWAKEWINTNDEGGGRAQDF